MGGKEEVGGKEEDIRTVLDHYDVACLLYDSSDPKSFQRASKVFVSTRMYITRSMQGMCGASAAKEPVHEFCTAHSARQRKKKKGVTQTPTYVPYIYIEITDVPSMWGSLRSPNYVCNCVINMFVVL